MRHTRWLFLAAIVASIFVVGAAYVKRRDILANEHPVQPKPLETGVDGRAKSREPGLSDIEYFAQAMYEPNAFVVPGFNPGMPTINKPPIGLTDQEILCVIAYLQTLGGTPTVTLQTKHRYNAGTATPAAPSTGASPGGTQPQAPLKGEKR